MQQRIQEPLRTSVPLEFSPARRARSYWLAAGIWASLLICGVTGGMIFGRESAELVEFEQRLIEPGSEQALAESFRSEQAMLPAPVPRGSPADDVEPSAEPDETTAEDVEEVADTGTPEEIGQRVTDAIFSAPQQALDAAAEAQIEEEARADLSKREVELTAEARDTGHIAVVKRLLSARDLPTARLVALDCLAATPANAECHKLLGTVYAKLGDSENGAAQYREFLRIADPKHPDYDRVQQIIKAFENPK